MSKRIDALNKILEQEKLLKMAQEVGQTISEVDESTADRLAEEIFEKLFDQTLEEAGIKDLMK